MKILELTASKPFKYLWLKQINGIDLSVHCAKSLLGNYDNRVNCRNEHFENIELADSIYYLCGVSKPYVWENNFHLAFKPKIGSLLHVSCNGIDITIENAEQLPISPEYIDWSLSKAKFKSYNTCRNWQFANYLKSAHIFS